MKSVSLPDESFKVSCYFSIQTFPISYLTLKSTKKFSDWIHEAINFRNQSQWTNHHLESHNFPIFFHRIHFEEYHSIVIHFNMVLYCFTNCYQCWINLSLLYHFQRCRCLELFSITSWCLFACCLDSCWDFYPFVNNLENLIFIFSCSFLEFIAFSWFCLQVLE